MAERTALAASLVSVNAGLPKDVPWQGKAVRTGIWKQPVAGPVLARRLDLDGDGQGDLAGHVGEQRAVLVYETDSYRHWARDRTLHTVAYILQKKRVPARGAAMARSEGAALQPLARPVPLRQSVYETLVGLIVNADLRPNQHLVETDLARQLGVSRQPVREALHRLQAEGWVELRPAQGAFVHVPTDQEVDELLDVRQLLEAETARLAARAATPEQVKRLREIWQNGRSAADADEVTAAVAGNSAFHAAVAGIAGNSVLANLVGIVGNRVRWYYSLVAPARAHRSWEEHGELIDAIEAHDESRAMQLARRHAERTRRAYHDPH